MEPRFSIGFRPLRVVEEGHTASFEELLRGQGHETGGLVRPESRRNLPTEEGGKEPSRRKRSPRFAMDEELNAMPDELFRSLLGLYPARLLAVRGTGCGHTAFGVTL